MDGEGCTCYARHEGECACDADWTDSKLVQMRNTLDYILKEWNDVLDGATLQAIKECLDEQ